MPPEQTIVPFFVPLSVKPCQSRPAPPGAMHRAWSLFAYAERSMVHSIMAGGPATYRHRMLPVGVRKPGTRFAAEDAVAMLAASPAAARPMTMKRLMVFLLVFRLLLTRHTFGRGGKRWPK